MIARSRETRWNEAHIRGVALGAALGMLAGGCGSASSNELPPLPEPTASFGATLLGGAIYTLGGHLGAPHGFSTASESGAFRRLVIGPDSEWERLGTIMPALEGAGLVAHDGLLYRVGGLRVDNAPGQPEALHSVSTVARYDPATGQWTPVPDMPEGRSAHGTVVIGDRLYAVAGWKLDGDLFSGTFGTGGFVLDLAEASPTWQPIPEPPVKRRNLAVAAVGDAIYVIGGATDTPVAFSSDVYVLDTTAGTWSEGPKLPTQSALAGFGAAACSIGDSLYVNDADGIFRLDRGTDAWVSVGSMRTPRAFNALLCPREDQIIAVGGYDVASDFAITADVETITVSPPAR